MFFILNIILVIICQSNSSWNLELKEYLYAYLDCKKHTVRVGYGLGVLNISNAIEMKQSQHNLFNFSYFQMIFYYETLPTGFSYLQVLLYPLSKTVIN
ncbi:hypothetical protein HZS_2351 [Henneguya salminicola]|nr:hypothetical protein HZS_2351 [Henneguya salminicola]